MDMPPCPECGRGTAAFDMEQGVSLTTQCNTGAEIQELKAALAQAASDAARIADLEGKVRFLVHAVQKERMARHEAEIEASVWRKRAELKTGSAAASASKLSEEQVAAALRRKP